MECYWTLRFLPRRREPTHGHIAHRTISADCVTEFFTSFYGAAIRLNFITEKLVTDTPKESNVDPAVWNRWWEVNVKPVSDGQAVLNYLAPYVYRVAISNNRIVDCTSQSVTYQYTPSGTKKSKTRTVTGIEFVRGFLQHVLPKGFRKVRHYGWMASHSRTTRDHVKWLIWLFRGWTYWLGSGIAPQPERPVPLRPQCARCGGALRLLAILSPTGHVLAGPHSPQAILPEQAAGYFDTG